MDNPTLLLTTVVVVFFLLTTLTVSLRCYVRTRLLHCFGADDWLAVLSLMVFISQSTSLFVGVHRSIFGHPWTSLSQAAVKQGMKLIFLFELSYVAATSLVKLSIGLFLLRFTVEPLHARIIYGILALLCCSSVCMFIYALLQCRPVSAFWEQPFNATGFCNRNGAMNASYAYGVIVSIADWTLGLLPVLMVRKMHLNIRTKVYIAIVLALGSCASIATLARFAYVHDLTDPKRLFYDWGLVIWSLLEVGIALTASSAATLRPLIRQLRLLFTRQHQQIAPD